MSQPTPIDLVHAFYAKGLSEADGMNLLQDHGVVSDHCVWAGNVGYIDLPKAIEFIQKYEAPIEPSPR